MATISHTLLPTSAPALGVGSVKAGYQRFLYRWRRARLQREQSARIARELGAYSDRELAELGLARGDIDFVANGTFRRG